MNQHLFHTAQFFSCMQSVLKLNWESVFLMEQLCTLLCVPGGRRPSGTCSLCAFIIQIQGQVQKKCHEMTLELLRAGRHDFYCCYFFYRLTGDEAGTPYDKESMAIIHLNNTTVMYLKEVTKFLALVCFLREESFERKGELSEHQATTFGVILMFKSASSRASCHMEE